MNLQLLICEVSSCENAILTWFILYWPQFIRICCSFLCIFKKSRPRANIWCLWSSEKKIGPYDAHDWQELRNTANFRVGCHLACWFILQYDTIVVGLIFTETFYKIGRNLFLKAVSESTLYSDDVLPLKTLKAIWCSRILHYISCIEFLC